MCLLYIINNITKHMKGTSSHNVDFTTQTKHNLKHQQHHYHLKRIEIIYPGAWCFMSLGVESTCKGPLPHVRGNIMFPGYRISIHFKPA